MNLVNSWEESKKTFGLPSFYCNVVGFGTHLCLVMYFLHSWLPSLYVREWCKCTFLVPNERRYHERQSLPVSLGMNEINKFSLIELATLFYPCRFVSHFSNKNSLSCHDQGLDLLHSLDIKSNTNTPWTLVNKASPVSSVRIGHAGEN